jgi:hypothetical protein
MWARAHDLGIHLRKDPFMTRKTLVAALVIAWANTGTVFTVQQTWTGVISDSICGASHHAKTGSSGMSDRLCGLECIKSLADYVLVLENRTVVPIASQDFPGLPLRFNHLVRLTGELTDKGIVLTKVELPPAHVHIGHVVTSWRDTPNLQGLLTTAVADAKVAAAHAALASKASDNLDLMKLHAGHVLHALDPSVEGQGPGSGYGLKKAAGGALQHVGFAAGAEDASDNVKTHASHVSASLTDVMRWTDQAVVVAQKIRLATSAVEATSLADALATLTTNIVNGVDANKDGQIGWQSGEGGLQQAQQHMELMSKGEGL